MGILKTVRDTGFGYMGEKLGNHGLTLLVCTNPSKNTKNFRFWLIFRL